MNRSLLGLLVVCTGALLAQTLSAEEKIDYLTQVKPLLAHRCTTCHGPLKQESGLRLDAARFILKGGESGATLLPGKASKSLLIDAVNGEGDLQMPPEGEPLKPAEVELLRKWIEQGATAPQDEEVLADPGDHWAYNSPVRAELPQPKRTEWVANPLDAFIAAEHERRGLVPQAPAEKYLLLRRVYLDLIGLPPTPEQLRDFLADDSPDAYANVINALLESPRYGERWGRHWMDIWRYSDWYGYKAELRSSARHIWRWRDWIIESVNDDVGYDQMILEMLAADELDPTNHEKLRATGFLARHYYKFNRDVWLDSAVEHTAKAFLGLTVNCARCHDHKYDPIVQEDYYRFRAIFEPYRVRTDRIPGTPNVKKDGLPRAFDAELDAKTYLYERGNDKLPDKEHPLSPAVPVLFEGPKFEIQPIELPTDVFYPGIKEHIRQESLAFVKSNLNSKQKALAQAKQDSAAANEKLTKLKQQQQSKVAAIEADAANAFLIDDFSEPKPQVWRLIGGKWQYKNGKLLQQDVVKEIRSINSAFNHPRDFSATFQFQITGGETYHSVGLSFDYMNDDDSDGLYLSAYAPDSKVQVTHKRGGKSEYPENGNKRLPLAKGETHTLRVDIRDRLLNVYVDGRLELVYKLEHERREGRFALWTYDCAAELLHVRVDPLPVEMKLVERLSTGDQPTTAGQTIAEAEHMVAEAAKKIDLAKKQLVAAVARISALEARIAADAARFSVPPTAQADQRAMAASIADRNEALYQAVADVAGAELALSQAEHAAKSGDKKKVAALNDRKKKLTATQKKLKDAQEAVGEIDGKYRPLTEIHPRQSTGRRLALARWIADERNPLTARVAVNHIWMRHFGQPLVPNTFDFGLNGKPASHPRLLDWLAVEFMENGWSMKHLHRLIVGSNTYRMGSSTLLAAENKNSEIDPDNVSLWRMNSRRMEAEIVRDSVLAVAGQLDLTTGGPDLDPQTGQSTYRRSVYYRHAPEKRMTFLKLFDAASAHECYRRNETVVPQQALALANSSLSIEQARRLATILNEQIGAGPSSESTAAFIAALFQRVLCRRPSDEELTTCNKFLADQTTLLSDPQKLTTFTADEPTTDEQKSAVAPSAVPHLRARENLAHVLLNHNEFLTTR